MTDPAGEALPLPGLEQLDPQRPVSYVESGLRRTFARLAERDELTEADAARMAVAISAARVMAKKESSGRMSTWSNDARLLVEIIDSLAAAGDEVDEDLAVAMRQWSDALGIPAPGGSG